MRRPINRRQLNSLISRTEDVKKEWGIYGVNIITNKRFGYSKRKLEKKVRH